MKVLEQTEKQVTIKLSKDELLVISNALNEVCNGISIDDDEFQTRLGVEKAEAEELLKQLNTAT